MLSLFFTYFVAVLDKSFICEAFCWLNFSFLVAFFRWRANVKMLTFLQLRKNVSTSLLHAVPEFGSALLHIFRLIQELSEVEFFPERPAETFQFYIPDYATNSQRYFSFLKMSIMCNIAMLFKSFIKRNSTI